MLEITIPGAECWDESREMFVATKEQTIRLEHSLVSISKWETKWHKAFYSSKEKTAEEKIDYIRCMTLTKNVDPYIYNCLSEENIQKINSYIEDPMTATKFYYEKQGGLSRDTITSELIYYWMISLNIPVEFEKWHINRLLTLIKVFNTKNQPDKKMSTKEIIDRNRTLNKARREQLKSKG